MLVLQEDCLPHGETGGRQADLSHDLFLLQALQHQAEVSLAEHIHAPVVPHASLI